MSTVLDEQDDPHEFELFTRWLSATVALACIAEGETGDKTPQQFAIEAHAEAMKGAIH